MSDFNFDRFVPSTLRREEEEEEQPFRPPGLQAPTVGGTSSFQPPGLPAPASGGFDFNRTFGLDNARAPRAQYNPDTAQSSTNIEWSTRTMRWADRGLRFVSSVFSPVQLPQDLFFATVEGLADPNVNLWENWREIDWVNYSWWTPAPTRPTSGREMIASIGVEDPRLQRYLGLVADLAVDPLVFGAGLRAVSKASGGVTALVRAADRLDDVAQGAMLLGGMPTVRTARNVTSAFNRVAPPVVRAHVQRNLNGVGDLLRRVGGVEVSWPGSSETIGSMILPDASRNPAAVTRLSRLRGQAGEVVQDVNESIAQILSSVGDSRAGKWMQELLNSQSLHYQIPRLVRHYDPDVSNALLRSVYDTARQVSVGVVDGAIDNLPDAVRGFFREADDVAQSISPTAISAGSTPGVWATRQQGIDLVAREEARLVQLAMRRGLDPVDLVGSWRHALQKVTEADALMGYHASGMGVLREVFFESIANRGAGPQAGDLWRRYLSETMQGRGEQWLTRVVPEIKLATGASVTGSELFGRYGSAFSLSARAVIENIPQGHLRRAFGGFLGPGEFQRYENAIRTGNIIPSRFLDPQTVIPQLQGINPRATRHLQEYLDMMTSAGQAGAAGRAQVSSVVLNTTDFMQSLVRQGFNPQDAHNYVRAMARSVNPSLQSLAGDVQFYRRSQLGDAAGSMPAAAGGKNAFAQRQMMDLDELDVLLEMADPALSLAQSATATRRAMTSRNAIAELMRIGEEQGLVREITRQAAPAGWKDIARGSADVEPLLAPFANRAVHPILFREIMNVAAQAKSPPQFWQAWQRLRGGITGGFLANPATTVTNISGFFLTSWLNGVPVAPLLRNYLGVLRDIKTMGRNLPEYQEVGDLIQGALTNVDIVQRLPRLATNVDELPGLGQQLKRLGENLHRTYSDHVLRPRGAAAPLGLRYFEASEAVGRMAVYRTMTELGSSAADARTATRFAAFDYSAQPALVRGMKDLGLLAFPAFPFFMAGRSLNAMRKYPGRLAAIERTPGAMWTFAIPDEDERIATYAAMDEWMRTGKYIPVRDRGDGLWSMFPFGQFLPTDTIGRDSFVDSLQTMGLLGPFIDIVAALMQDEGTGEAPLTGRFGRRVFQEGAEGWEKFGQVMSFAYNSFAPGWARKAFRFSETSLAGPTGLIPEALNTISSLRVGQESGETMASFTEMLRRRPDRDLIDELVGFTVRTVRPVSAAPGATSGLTRQLEQGRFALERQIRDKGKAAAAAMQGPNPDPRAAARLQVEIGRLLEKFEERYGPMIEVAGEQRNIFPGVTR